MKPAIDCDGTPLALGDRVVFLGGVGVYADADSPGTLAHIDPAKSDWYLVVRFDRGTSGQPTTQFCAPKHVRKLVAPPTHADELTQLLLGG